MNDRRNFVARSSNEKLKKKLITTSVLIAIAVIIGISVYNFTNIEYNNDNTPDGAGKLGDEHIHASILVRIFGDKFDFSLPAYQIKNSWIHFEARDGSTIHMHSTGVKLGYLFESLGITITENCYIFPDQREFCTNEKYSLKFYINQKKIDSITNYVINENDRILISYGNENESQIQEQLIELESQAIIN
ncbi:MAG: protein-disulfide isomerase [Thaumarchaeota archaeon]|nr:protein-disulfide isomerase [Nitrososphaerota archaeon]MCY3975593.1 protein-disulfide isomerase [Nitrososphaerota archaeon]